MYAVLIEEKDEDCTSHIVDCGPKWKAQMVKDFSDNDPMMYSVSGAGVLKATIIED